MQKIKIKENTNIFVAEMLSLTIVYNLNELQRGFRAGSDLEKKWNALKFQTIQEIVKSKSNFDNLIQTTEELKIISDAIDTEVYTPENLAEVISILSNTTWQGKHSLFTQIRIIDFYNYHKGLISTESVVNSVILEDLNRDDIVLFTIVCDSNPTTQVIITALTTLQELIDLIEEIYNEERTNTVYILDKGSNSNLGIETGVKTAGSIFQIFKEVWEWIVNRKFYKEKLKNAAFVDELSIIRTIAEMKEEGSLNHEEALRYKTVIIRKVDELLNIDTVPRELLLKEGNKNDSLILKDYNEIRLLNQGNEDESDS
jgi:hypothetical protein